MGQIWKQERRKGDERRFKSRLESAFGVWRKLTDEEPTQSESLRKSVNVEEPLTLTGPSLSDFMFLLLRLLGVKKFNGCDAYCIFLFKVTFSGAVEMAPQFLLLQRTQGLVPSAHRIARNLSMTSLSGEPMPSSGFLRHYMYMTQMQAEHSYT